MRLSRREYEILKARTQRKNTQSKRNSQVKQVGKTKDEKENTSRSIVRITSYRCISIDPDNFFCKWHVDGLRYAKIIRDDSERDIELHVSQKKVKTRAEERTEIEIIKQVAMHDKNKIC